MIMKKLLILGAGGFGREVYSWLSDWCEKNNDWKISGFIDDNLTALEGFNDIPPVLFRISDYQPSPDEFIVCAIGSPQIKKSITQDLTSKNANFFTLQHPSAIVGKRVTIGIGTVICPNAVITTDVSIGKFVTINAASTVGHDASIGDYSTLSGHCDVTGGAKLDECVFMGSHAVVLPKTYVGSNACIGAGSVALRKVAPGSTVFGVPAKRISG